MKIQFLSRLVVCVAVLTSGCSTSSPTCGDTLAEGRETCDDGNTFAGDGCDATCRIEFGFECSEPNGCAGVCGDGFLVSDEVCDWAVPNPYCAHDCNSTEGSCGDLMIQATLETCDDGNSAVGDGCNACDASYGFTCTAGACDASTVVGTTSGNALTSGDRTALCTWFIDTLGGAGTKVTCGNLIYTINSVSGCASQIGGLGMCTVTQFEAWVANKGNACAVLSATDNVCN